MKHISVNHFSLIFLLFISTSAFASSNGQPGLELWGKIHEVFSHPRCSNCHVPEDNRPRWSGPSYGETRFHGMNINGGASRIGAETMFCSSCHGNQNSDLPHGPPGAQVWLLAPVEMTWWNKTSQEICEQVKDPERNGGRDLKQVAEHIEKDHLVHWGWNPGVGREPAPYSAEELVGFILKWHEFGSPCPES